VCALFCAGKSLRSRHNRPLDPGVQSAVDARHVFAAVTLIDDIMVSLILFEFADRNAFVSSFGREDVGQVCDTLRKEISASKSELSV
jgi:hypothetical protein